MTENVVVKKMSFSSLTGATSKLLASCLWMYLMSNYLKKHVFTEVLATASERKLNFWEVRNKISSLLIQIRTEIGPYRFSSGLSTPGVVFKKSPSGDNGTNSF